MTLRNAAPALAAVALAAALAGCTSGNAGQTVPFTSQTIDASLQFAVGTANIGYVGGNATGLNTIVTFRNNTSGQDGSLLNTPVITGPAGFLVPPSEPGNSDAGTAHISGNAQTIVAPVTPATFGTSGGAFAYGFEPDNSDTSGSANFNAYSLPFYADQIPAAAGFSAIPFGGGPPYFPRTTDGTYPAGFSFFTQGFTDFVAAPVHGTYGLTVTVPSAQTALTQTFKATGTLNSVVPLAAIAAPTFAEDGSGGLSVTVTLPAGLTEAAAYVFDATAAGGSGSYFTVAIPAAAGLHTVALGDALGASTGGPPDPTIAVGDSYFVTVVGFDYLALEAAAPKNTSPKPVIVGANGQADITVSPSVAATYGDASSGAAKRHRALRRTQAIYYGPKHR